MSQVIQPAPTPAPRPRIPLRRKILYAGLCFLFALVVAEVGLRVRARIKYGSAGASALDSLLAHDDALGQVVPRPSSELKGETYTIRINSLGFRGDEITAAKPSNTVRIACVGASTTFCAEASTNQATWPHRLQEALQARYPDVSIQVINAGVPGYNALQSLKNLTHRVLALQPDLVIYYEANNDMAHDLNKLAHERGLIDDPSGKVPPWVQRLSEISLLFDLTYKNLVISRSQSEGRTSKLNGVPKDLPQRRFTGLLGAMHQELQARGVPFVLSTYLVKYRRDQTPAAQAANIGVLFYYMPWATPDDFLDAMDYYNEAIVAFARANGVPVLEERVSIPGDDRHFVDYIHLTDAGCAKMAERFDRFLEEQKLVQPLVDRVRAARGQPPGKAQP